MENGTSVFEGATDEAVDFYLTKNSFEKNLVFTPKKSGYIDSVTIKGSEDKDFFVLGDKIFFEISLKNSNIKFNDSNKIVLAIYNEKEEKICKLSTEFAAIKSREDKNKIICIIERNPIVSGNYFINMAVFIDNKILEHFDECLKFTILDGDFYGIGKLIGKSSYNFTIEQQWH